MKGKGGFLVVLLLVVVGGYFLYTKVLGGSLTGTGPTKGLPTTVPDVNLPPADDVANKGAKGAEDGANWLSDFLANMTPGTWKVVGVLIVASALYWLWKDPKRRSLALVVIVIGLLAVIAG